MLAIARRKYSGEERTTVVYECLSNLSTLMGSQSFHKEALALNGEAYDLVSGVYGPEHPTVQDAANLFISNLETIGDCRTEDFARMNYETLISGAHPESSACADIRNIQRKYPQNVDVQNNSTQLLPRGFEDFWNLKN